MIENNETKSEPKLTPEEIAAQKAATLHRRKVDVRQRLLIGAVNGMHTTVYSEYLNQPRQRDIAVYAMETEVELTQLLCKIPSFRQCADEIGG